MAVLVAGLLVGAGGYTAMAQVEPAGVLSVTPADDFTCSGLGGEIIGVTKTYTLTNIGAAALDWIASWSTSGDYWALSTPVGSILSGQGGTLAAGESVPVTVMVVSLPPYDGLNDPGYASTTLAFTNVTNGLGNTSRHLSIIHKRPASVSFYGPTQATLVWVKGDTASRVFGAEWSWENRGNYYLSSSVSVDRPWLTLHTSISHPCCGCGGADVKGNSVANTLPIGSHGATVSFSFSGKGLNPADQHKSATVTLRVVWPGDINADFAVDVADLLYMVASWNKTSGQSGYNKWCDINRDNTVDMADLLLFMENWGQVLE